MISFVAAINGALFSATASFLLLLVLGPNGASLGPSSFSQRRQLRRYLAAHSHCFILSMEWQTGSFPFVFFFGFMQQNDLWECNHGSSGGSDVREESDEG